MTNSTPGADFAAEMSIDEIRPLGIVLQIKAA
jgi:hypothetical protein